MCAVIPVAGQRTHGTTFRALKVASQVETPGAESAVYDCLVWSFSTFSEPPASAEAPLPSYKLRPTLQRLANN